MNRKAAISDNGLYRFDLLRAVQAGCNCKRCKGYTPTVPGYVLFCLCNPSKADASVDDSTERRGWAYTKTWGYGAFVFVNTNPYRSTVPYGVPVPDIATQMQNERHLEFHAQRAAIIVCAWGTNASRTMASVAENILRRTAPDKMHILELSKSGVPKHPLYLSGSLTPKPWRRS